MLQAQDGVSSALRFRLGNAAYIADSKKLGAFLAPHESYIKPLKG